MWACIDWKFCCLLHFPCTMFWHVEHLSLICFCLVFLHSVHFEDKPDCRVFFYITWQNNIKWDNWIGIIKVLLFALFNHNLHLKCNSFLLWIILQSSSNNCGDCCNKIVNSSKSKIFKCQDVFNAFFLQNTLQSLHFNSHNILGEPSILFWF